jgi:hypothetical protein
MFGALAGVALAFPFFWMVGTKEWIMIALAFILARGIGQSFVSRDVELADVDSFLAEQLTG